MTKRTFLALLVSITIMISSCVSGKKFKASEEENLRLNNKVTELRGEVTELQKQLTEITARDEKVAAEMKQYVAKCEKEKEQLMAVQTMLDEEYKTMQAMKDKISEALADFDDKGVEVFYKDGLVYVSMEDNLMYKPGSASLGPNSKDALSKLANVLNSYPNLKVIVLGNTDDTQFKKGTDNWSLSTERANGVIRVLRDEFKVDPVRLTAAGKSKYNPVADNSTKEGKAKNRRTEIILNPDMQKIWDSVKEN